MIPSAALILGAGLGTRMGPLGLVLPKVLFPLFQKTMVDFHILYLKKLGIKKIVVNLHHCAPLLAEHLNRVWPEVIQSHEEILQDVGGAVHYLLSKKIVSPREHLLVVAGDAFFIQDENEWVNFFNQAEAYPVTLLALYLEEAGEYNTLDVKNGLLQGIIKKEDSSPKSVTYSGISVIDLSSLNYQEGPSKFFDTVAVYKKVGVSVFETKKYEYWDFGTVDRYLESTFRLLNSDQSAFHALLKKWDFISNDLLLNNESAFKFYDDGGCKQILTLWTKERPLGSGIGYKNLFSPLHL